MRSTSRSLAAVLVGLCVVLSACSHSKTKSPVAASDTGSMTLQPIPGTSSERITLAPRAAYRIGIQTVPIGDAGGKLERIPSAAVMYTPDGNTYTYTSPSPLTFVRAPIVVARTAGAVTYLRTGPPAGTRVVTVGSDELLGIEEGVQDEEGTVRNAQPEIVRAPRHRRR